MMNETLRLKEPMNTYRDIRRNSKEQIKKSTTESCNVAPPYRLYCILKQNRHGDTEEFAPGWRTGVKGEGIVVDRYANSKSDCTKRYWLHSRSQANTRAEKVRVRF